jgi:hypothetical protein
LGDEPGWADREIRYEPLAWDADGYPVVGGSRAPGEFATVTSAPGMSPGRLDDGLGRVA